MNTFGDLLLRTEELERRMTLAEARQKKQFKLLHFSADSLALPPNTAVAAAEFNIPQNGGQAVLFASFGAVNPYAADITVQLLVGSSVAAERILPASQTKPFQFCIKAALQTQGKIVLSVRAVTNQQITLTNAEFDVLGSGLQ